jgi:hypothetical protein
MEDDRMCGRNIDYLPNGKLDSGRYFNETGG